MVHERVQVAPLLEQKRSLDTRVPQGWPSSQPMGAPQRGGGGNAVIFAFSLCLSTRASKADRQHKREGFKV